MFAVIKTGGKQYRVAADDLVEVDKIDGEPGAAIAFAEVLMLGGEEPVVGAPTVAGATVAGEVVEQGRKPKVIAFKKRRRKNSRRKRGHRQEFTLVRITEISTAGGGPAAKAAKATAEPADAPAPASQATASAEAANPPAAEASANAPPEKAEEARPAPPAHDEAEG